MEREIQTLKELLAQIISPEAKGDPNLALVEVIFHINFLSFGDKGFSPAYKHWACLPWDIPATGEVEKFYIPTMATPSPWVAQGSVCLHLSPEYHHSNTDALQMFVLVRTKKRCPRKKLQTGVIYFCDFLYLCTVVCSAFCGGFVGPCPTTPYSFAHEDWLPYISSFVYF